MNTNMENEKIDNNPWTKEEDTTLKTYYTFGGITEARKHLNRTDAAIRTRAKRLKLKSKNWGKKKSKTSDKTHPQKSFSTKNCLPTVLTLKDLNEADYLDCLTNSTDRIWLSDKLFTLFSNGSIETFSIWIYTILALKCKEQGNAWVDIKEIISTNGCSMSAARKSIRELMAQNIIWKRNGWRSRGIPDTYKLNQNCDNELNVFPVPLHTINAAIANKLYGGKMLLLLYFYYIAYNKAIKTSVTTNKISSILMTHDMMGNALGVTRHVAVKYITSMVKEGYIEKNENCITIGSVSPDRDELQEYVSKQNDLNKVEVKENAIDSKSLEKSWYGNSQNFMNNALYDELNVLLKDSGLYIYCEVKYAGCMNKRLLKFDFAICSEKQIDPSFPNIEDVVANVEYQGGQHFYPKHKIYKTKGISEFDALVNRDEIKRMWCIENDIPLITKEIQSAAYVHVMAQQIYDEVMLYASKKQKQKKIA